MCIAFKASTGSDFVVLSNFEDYFHCEDPPLSRRASFKRERTPHSLSRLGLGVLAAAQNTKVRSFSFNLFLLWDTIRKQSAKSVQQQVKQCQTFIFYLVVFLKRKRQPIMWIHLFSFIIATVVSEQRTHVLLSLWCRLHIMNVILSWPKISDLVTRKVLGSCTVTYSHWCTVVQ